MKRVQLFEFEDQKWFSSSMRVALTKLIVVLHKLMGMNDVLSNLISDALGKSKTNSIVDLGSGAGGAMPQVIDQLRKHDKHSKVNMILTDLYPNSKAVETINQLGIDGLSYHPDSVNATQLKKAPKGLKTMVNSFHHMSPDMAKSILRSAVEERQPILIYEMAENKIPLILWWLLLPISLLILVLMVFIMTPFVKPLTFHQLFFTYIIPIIPICYAWDGQASLPRIYALNDFDELLSDIDSSNFKWEKGPALNKKGKQQGYYVLGYPTED